MFNRDWKRIGLLLGFSLLIIIAGCGTDKNTKENASDNSSKNDADKVNYTITGIEPGAGIMQATEKALKEYENLAAGWKVDIASTGAMTAELSKAIDKKKPIIITGWTPHWKFAKYDLKFLEDPKGIYGDIEEIRTIARKGLKEDMPNAYQILDRFYWTPEDMESVMLASQDGKSMEEAAKEWIEANMDKVAEWTDGVDEENEKAIELVHTQWDSEMASTSVVAEVLRQKGFDVKMTPVDVAIMFQSVAAGEGDAAVGAWLPATHKDVYEKYKDDLDDLGANLEGAKIGLVVPIYMDIESIEDLPFPSK